MQSQATNNNTSCKKGETMNKRSKFDSIVLNCVQDLTPNKWSYSPLLGGRFRVIIRANIESFEDGSFGNKTGIRNTLYYFRNMKDCVGASFNFDGVVAYIDMYIDDSNIILEYDRRDGWFGNYSNEGTFNPVRIGVMVFYRGKTYKAGEEIPHLIISTGGNYVTYSRH